MTSASQDGAFDAGIVTVNEQAMRRFYEDVLGFEYVATIPIGQDMLTKLRHGQSFLKLYVPARRPHRMAAAGDWTSRTGIRYFTVPVDDIRSVVERCRVKGVSVDSEIVELPGDRLAAFIADPDGNAIELFQDAARMEPPLAREE